MDQALSDEQVLARLTGPLRHWRLDQGWLTRLYRTHGWKGTTLVVGAIAHLAEAAWHHPEIIATYDRVQVKLLTHSSQSITLKDIALAAKIEDVIHWRPGQENGVLTGTPEDDCRFGYIRYDD